MNALGRALWAETLKTKRTLALAMTVLAPLVITVLMLAMYLQNQELHFAKAGDDPWGHYSQNMFVMWALLMLPLFITLETALVSGLEYSRKNWTLLYSLPVPRWAYYAAKEIVSLTAIGLSTIVLIGMMWGSATLLQAIDPRYGFDAAVPWAHLLGYAGMSYLASWLIISIHLWVSSRWASFVVSLGVGIAATVVAAFALNDELARFYPWTLPGYLVALIKDGAGQTPVLALGALGGLIFAVFAGWDIARRDVL